MNVAVIGAGPAGLVAARELRRYQIDTTVFESQHSAGGLWIYDKNVEDDPLGVNPSARIHSSLYDSLRTNLPRDLMAFSDYTFDSKGGGADNWPRYPHHSQVLQYLQKFCDDFDLTRLIRFGETVTDVKQAERWQVTSSDSTEDYDAVVVANGHYCTPRIPQLKNIEKFQGSVVHAHNYRRPDAFTGKRVALWGSSASGFDLSMEIASVAETVYWCGSAFTSVVPMGENRTGMPTPTHIDDSGRLVIREHALEIDTLVYCTGYHYNFPFLSEEVVDVDDDWVNPLYRDIVPPGLSSIGFIGLPFLIVPFPVFEIQAKWFVRQLAGEFSLPDSHSQEQHVREHSEAHATTGDLQRHYHRLGDRQFEYCAQLAAEAGIESLPDWFRETWLDAGRSREQDPINFRSASLPVRGPTICQ